MSKAMWGGRFSKSTDEMINEFQASINFDKRMYHEDIAGSIAHATMLAKCGIITDEDRDKIVAGLKDILQKIEEGNFEFSVDLEDIHMNIEKRLTDAIGDHCFTLTGIFELHALGKKLTFILLEIDFQDIVVGFLPQAVTIDLFRISNAQTFQIVIHSGTLKLTITIE